MGFFTKGKKTTVQIDASAPTPGFNFNTSAEREERKGAGDPLGPLRRICSQNFVERRLIRKHEEVIGRPFYFGRASFRLGAEMDKLIEAINQCDLYRLKITPIRNGDFETFDDLVEQLVPKLTKPICKLSILVGSFLRQHSHKRLELCDPPLREENAASAWAGPGAQELIKRGFRPPLPLTDDTFWLSCACRTESNKAIRQPPKTILIKRVNGHSWFIEPPNPQTRFEVMRSLAVARVLLLAKRGERTGIADLPTEIIHAIVRASSRDPDALTPKEWAVIFRHAEDRHAFAAVARAVARSTNSPFYEPSRYSDSEKTRSRSIRDEWLLNGGFMFRKGAV